mmetsp:Transcript_22241/g.58026  ORF Transcript_22241/g.58026 Transcript_22241/m.58026 type:complete len:255 (-) Transcript_22241:166-930(-)
MLREAPSFCCVQEGVRAGRGQERARGAADAVELRGGRPALARAAPRRGSLAVLLRADGAGLVRGAPHGGAAGPAGGHLRLRRLGAVQQCLRHAAGRGRLWERRGPLRQLAGLGWFLGGRDWWVVLHGAEHRHFCAGVEEGLFRRGVRRPRLDREGRPGRSSHARAPQATRSQLRVPPEQARERLPEQLQGRAARSRRGAVPGGHAGVPRRRRRLRGNVREGVRQVWRGRILAPLPDASGGQPLGRLRAVEGDAL